jgi:hypothetical protein
VHAEAVLTVVAVIAYEVRLIRVHVHPQPILPITFPLPCILCAGLPPIHTKPMLLTLLQPTHIHIPSSIIRQSPESLQLVVGELSAVLPGHLLIVEEFKEAFAMA